MVPLSPEHTLHAAFAHHRAGRIAEAAALYRSVLAQDPRQVDAWHQLGVLALSAGRGVEAAGMIAKAIELQPAEANFHANLGVAMALLGRHEESCACFDRAIALRPGVGHFHSNRADALLALRRVDEAIASYQHSINLQPDAAYVHNNLGNAFMVQGRLREAAASYRRATQLAPDLLQAQTNLSDALTKLGQFDEALECCRRAVAIQPTFPGAHLNMGVVFWRRGEFVQAKACYLKALECDPQSADAHLNLGLLLLLLGEFREGWREYEWRFRSTALTRQPRHFSIPRWGGEPAVGKTILIYVDQGLGDTIQFLRYVPLVREHARAARVILECQPELMRLVKQSGDWGAEIVTAESEMQADLHVPLLSLPPCVDRPEPLRMDRPYLLPDEATREQWRARLSASPAKRVGLAWAGSPLHRDDRLRSIPFEQLQPLLRLPNVQFYSLQIQPPSVADSRVVDFTTQLTDFAETAALVSELDLVITVDSAVAHLAGALGRPVWTLLPFVPDWRWGVGSENTPWYPSMRLFRQRVPGDWAEVLRRVEAELGALE